MRDTVETQPKPILGERFKPEPEQVMPMIKAAERRRLELKQGLKSGTEEKPLQEAIWLAEALMSYEKGDASRYGDGWVTGVANYSFEVQISPDGGVWVSESDFFSSYDEAKLSIEAAIGQDKVYMLDHELVSLNNGHAHITIEWTDKDPNQEIAGPYNPPNSGCHDVHTAATMLNRLLKWTYHAELPIAPAFIATIHPPSGLWINVFPNGSADPNSFGITGYFGTSSTPYGPGLLYNSVLPPSALCFPDMWNRFTLFRGICKEHISWRSRT